MVNIEPRRSEEGVAVGDDVVPACRVGLPERS
jgi:hypothetical protein